MPGHRRGGALLGVGLLRMLSMKVDRVVVGAYFEPHIVDIEDEGCVFLFHKRDITVKGADYFAQVMTDQARRWAPRTPEMPRGGIIPVRIIREPDLPEPFAIHLDDSAESITYTVDEVLISEHGAEVISRLLTERSPHWQRVPDALQSLHDAV